MDADKDFSKSGVVYKIVYKITIRNAFHSQYALVESVQINVCIEIFDYNN